MATKTGPAIQAGQPDDISDRSGWHKTLRSPWTLTAACLVFFVCFAALAPILIGAWAKASLNRLLAEGRSKGIVTTLEEQRARHPSVPESQNAAPLYRKLEGQMSAMQTLDYAALRGPVLKRDPAQLSSEAAPAHPSWVVRCANLRGCGQGKVGAVGFSSPSQLLEVGGIRSESDRPLSCDIGDCRAVRPPDQEGDLGAA